MRILPIECILIVFLHFWNVNLTEAANYILRHHGEKFIHITDGEQVFDAEPELQENGLRKISPLAGRIFLSTAEIRSIMPIISEEIKHLAIDFNSTQDPVGLLNDIMEYCSDKLISIEFYGFNTSCPMLNASFPNVENVAFVDGTIGENLLQFNKWFPAMKSLKLSNVNITNPKLVTIQFEHLESLTLEIDEINSFSLDDFADILEENRKIRHLNIIEISYGYAWAKSFSPNIRGPDTTLIEFIGEILPELEELTLGKHTELIIDDRTPVTFNKLKKLEVYFDNWKQWYKFPYESEKIETLSIEFTGSLHSEMIDFIEEQTELTKLKLVRSGIVDGYTAPIQFTVSLLPKLSELYLDGLYVSEEDLKEILIGKPSLNKIEWVYYDYVPTETDESEGSEVTSYSRQIPECIRCPRRTRWQCTAKRFEKYIVFTYGR